MTQLLNPLRLAFIAVLLCLQVPLVLAADTPATLDGTTLVNADKVKELLAKGVPVIDARVANEYAEAHIKGAINVPYKEKSAKAANFDASQDSFDLAKLPKDKAAPLVFYCNAGECWKSAGPASDSLDRGMDDAEPL